MIFNELKIYPLLKLNTFMCILILQCYRNSNNKITIELLKTKNSFRVRSFLFIIGILLAGFIVLKYRLKTILSNAVFTSIFAMFTTCCILIILFTNFHNGKELTIFKSIMEIRNELMEITNRQINLRNKLSTIFLNIQIVTQTLILCYIIFQPVFLNGDLKFVLVIQIPFDILATLYLNLTIFLITILIIIIVDYNRILNIILKNQLFFCYDSSETMKRFENCINVHHMICHTSNLILKLYSSYIYMIIVVSFYEVLNNLYNIYAILTVQSCINEFVYFLNAFNHTVQLYLACAFLKHEVR